MQHKSKGISRIRVFRPITCKIMIPVKNAEPQTTA
jgi:hypothetical protein